MTQTGDANGGGERFQPFLEALERRWPPEAAVTRREEFGYDRETCLLFGQWMLQSVTEVYGEQQSITREMIEVASKHGYGPSERPIKDNFGGALWRFNEELGSLHGRATGRYDEWTEDDFVRHGHRVILQYGLDKPDKAAFEAEFMAGRGPSLDLIADRFGEKGRYFEQLGYVNPKRWSTDDYERWAADVRASGMGLDLKATTIGYIAKHRMGPSDNAIYRNYGSLVDLQLAAEARVADYSDEDVEVASRRFGVYMFVTRDAGEDAAQQYALSTRLKIIAHEGDIVARLSAPAVTLLNLLLNHIDAPVYRDDFYEQYWGDGRQRADNTAFDELQSLSLLASHLVSLQVGNERVYGLSSTSDDISLLVQRAESAALYMGYNKLGFKPTEPDDEVEHHRLRTVTLSALGLAAAGASVLLIRRNRMHK